MRRTIDNTVMFVKKYLLKKYNYFVIDINSNFIGCKFHNDKYYIFSINGTSNDLILGYRLDFTKEEMVKISILDFTDEVLSIMIDNIIETAFKTNNKLGKPRKKLANSLVYYDYDNGTIDEQKKIKKKKKDCFIFDSVFSDGELSEYRDLPLERVKMSQRLRNGLINSGKKTLGDFISLSSDELVNIKNIGATSLDEASRILYELKASPSSLIIDTPIEPDVLNFDISENLIDKLYDKYKIDECDLSNRLKNALIHNEINSIADFIKHPFEEIEKIDNLGKKTVSEARDFRNNLALENDYSNGNPDFVYRVIKALAGNKEITVIMLKNYLRDNTNYPVNKLIEDIDILRGKNKIEYSMNGIRIRLKKLSEWINSLDAYSKKLFSDRLDGRTLQELGDFRGITRERVRQRLSKIIEKIPIIYEDKYKDRFECYNFTEGEFKSIFNESSKTYNYLKERYKAGSKGIELAIDDDRFNELQKSRIKDMKKIIRVFGETMTLNKQNIVNILIKKYAIKSMLIEDFQQIYNDYCKDNAKYDLPLMDYRSTEGMITRSGIVVFGMGRKFRYYDYATMISQEDYNFLRDIYYNMDTGYYSTCVIFNNNSKLMSSIDVRDEYELHNISKNYLNCEDIIKFDRMPNFAVRGAEKEIFIEEKIKELSPISLNDFAEIMEQEYGHKSGTLLSYITSNFQQYIDNGVLKTTIPILSDGEVIKLKSILTKPVYSLDDLKELLIKNGYDNNDEIINSANMYRIGYRTRSSYIIKKEINSLEDYLKQVVCENDFISDENLLKCSTYYLALKKLEKSYDIVLISNSEYITIKKLNSLGITKEDIYDFCNQVGDSFKNADYFTLSNIRETLDIGKLDDFGFDDIFLESIISNISDITYNNFSNNRIFSFVFSFFDSKKFVVDTIGTQTGIFIDDLQEEFLRKYGINVTQERIKNAIMDTELYCCDELNKIYQNKEYYYEEVFSNE